MTKRLGGEHHTAHFEPVTQPVRMRFKNGEYRFISGYELGGTQATDSDFKAADRNIY